MDGKDTIVEVIVKNYPNSKQNNKFYLHEIIKIGTSHTAVENNAIRVNEQVPIDSTTISQKNSAVNSNYTQKSSDNVENAILLDSRTIPNGKTKSNNSAIMHSLYAIADMGNGRELIKLYVEELNDVNSDGTIKRAYQLQNINKILLESNRFSNNSLASSDQQNTYTVSQLFEFVKTFDKNFKPNEVSKVVNDDGTPKIVYHGTSENFTVFDITKSRSYDEKLNYDLPGFYFSENSDESGSYGGNLGTYYINIKKPYSGDTYALSKELGSFRKAYDYLVEQGYDGIIVALHLNKKRKTHQCH